MQSGQVSSFRIGRRESEYVVVKVLSRAHNAQDYWDGNWLTAEIEIAVGGFFGKFGAYLRSEEIVSFRGSVTRLYSFESRDAKFETMEGQLSIDIKGDSLGHFSAECEALDSTWGSNRLRFALAFDQSDIPEILKGLDSITSQFEVVGSPTD